MQNNIVAEKIQALLNAKNMSIPELAERAGLTVAQIDFILTSPVVPSLSPIIKIARALGVRLGTFLDDSDQLGPVIHRVTEHTALATFSSQLSDANSHLDFFSLAGNKTGRHMEPFVISINPSKDNEPLLSSHEGEEFIYVLEGAVSIIYGKESIVLNQGESIYYDSIVDHLVSAVDSIPAKILAVVYTPV